MRLTGVIDKLVVYPDNMQKNMDQLGGLAHSQRVLLLALTQAGVVSRRLVSTCTTECNESLAWRGRFPNFLKS